MSQSGRIVALALAAIGTLVLLLWLLVQHAGGQQQQQLAAQREAYLLRHLRISAENYLATGLQLEQMQALQDMLEREQTAFADILAIDVFNPAGTVLYSTDPGSRGTAVPAQWRELLAREQPWQGSSPGQRQVGLRFDNDLAQAAGGIVITVSTAAAPATLADWYARSRQLLRWLAVALLAALATGVAVHLGLRHLGRPYDAAAGILRAVAADRVGAGGASAPQDGLLQAAVRQRQLWQHERQQCHQALEQLEALDHEA